jgi:hypothetical protein
MDTQAVLRSQHQAALEMLRQAIIKCPAPMWDSPDDRARFWHVAYHALFYTHLYLQDSVEAFAPWAGQRKGYESLQPEIGEPYTKDEVLAYLEVCRRQIDERMRQIDLEAESGFAWLPFGKLELQIYSIRHLQQHTGELMERLGSRADIDVGWVGRLHS